MRILAYVAVHTAHCTWLMLVELVRTPDGNLDPINVHVGDRAVVMIGHRTTPVRQQLAQQPCTEE